MLFERSATSGSTWLFGYATALRWGLLLALLFPLDARAAEDEEDEIPKPEDVVLATVDGVQLHATYFPGRFEKKSMPVMLLHAYKRDRHDFDSLAQFLQQQGHAAITVDLRGHGDSTEVRRDAAERSEKISATALRPADIEAMCTYDVEAVKVFLRDKNNEGELNLDKLVVVGEEMGALVAAAWTAYDWSATPLATGKQGQFVKDLVLISPEMNIKGLKIDKALGHPAVRSEVAVLLIAGKQNGKAREEVNRIYSLLEKSHSDPEKKDLERFLPDTRLQSWKLLDEKSLKVNERIAEFIAPLVKRTIPWAEHKKPIN